MDFAVISAAEWMTCIAAAGWIARRVIGLSRGEGFLIPFAAATVMRYLLRKELLQDIRGLRRRSDDIQPR
jgi:hypothetical protein